MDDLKKEELWFNTPDTFSLCRGGGNGPQHPSQYYAILKYVEPGMSFLDYGCGSATTLECLVTRNDLINKLAYRHPTKDNERIFSLKYKGLDIIPKNIEWCKKQFDWADFEVNKILHKIDQPDKSFDVVYSRHVVDHMKSFEDAMDEHKRVAKKLVIVILWTGLIDKDEHEIKNIIDQRGLPTEKLYPNEYTNNYSRKLVTEYLTSDPEWELLELTDDVGAEVSGHDTVIVLRRVDAT